MIQHPLYLYQISASTTFGTARASGREPWPSAEKSRHSSQCEECRDCLAALSECVLLWQSVPKVPRALPVSVRAHVLIQPLRIAQKASGAAEWQPLGMS